MRIIYHSQPYLPEERETHFNYDDSCDTAKVETFNAAYIRALIKLAEKNPNEVTIIREYIRREPDGELMDGTMVELPKAWIRAQAPPKITEEQRKAMVERGKLAILNLRSKSVDRDPQDTKS